MPENERCPFKKTPVHRLKFFQCHEQLSWVTQVRVSLYLSICPDNKVPWKAHGKNHALSKDMASVAALNHGEYNFKIYNRNVDVKSLQPRQVTG